MNWNKLIVAQVLFVTYVFTIVSLVGVFIGLTGLLLDTGIEEPHWITIFSVIFLFVAFLMRKAIKNSNSSP